MKSKSILRSVLPVLILICGIFTFTACKKTKTGSFNLSFKVDGETYATVTTNGSEIITIPDNPSKNGYEFDGWYRDNGEWKKPFTANSLLNAPITSDLSVYAKFNATEYALAYVTNGGTHDNPSKFTVEDHFALSDAEKSGYAFCGWYKDEAYTEKIESIRNLTGDLTIYAKFEMETFSITYENSDGADNTNPTNYTVETDDITLQPLSKTGYSFDGWYNGETKVEKIEKGSTGDVTLTAKWRAIAYTRVSGDGTASKSGEYILFGSYPQTKITDNALISKLNAQISNSIPTSEAPAGWTSYGYYISCSVQNYMWYRDVELDGTKYRAVYFTCYRPNYCYNSSSEEDTFQDDNGYSLSTIYWFQFEPIKWRILEEKDGKAFLAAELALDSQQFDYDENPRNNYADSTIRKWLNDNFYNTAFNADEQAVIQTTSADNSVESTGYSENEYACPNTDDKIFLLSYQEATNESYGFTPDAASSTTRQKQSTDYAKSQGCWQSTKSGYAGNCGWWLRSPNMYTRYSARYVYSEGSITNYSEIPSTSRGVVPALYIVL